MMLLRYHYRLILIESQQINTVTALTVSVRNSKQTGVTIYEEVAEKKQNFTNTADWK